MKATIINVVLASENIIISYSMLDDMVTGRLTIPMGEFSEARLKSELEKDIESRKESILAIKEIVERWKGQQLDFDLEK